MRTAILIAQGFFFALVMQGQPVADVIMAAVINGALVGLYGGTRFNEGVTEGKRQAGRDLRGPGN